MLCQSSHGLILYFQNDQSGRPVLTFGKRSPLKSDQDHFLSWNYFLSFPIMFLTSCKPPLSWLIVWGDSWKTTHLHILVGYLLEVHPHFPFLVGLKYYFIITCFTLILVMMRVRGRESFQTKKKRNVEIWFFARTLKKSTSPWKS